LIRVTLRSASSAANSCSQKIRDQSTGVDATVDILEAPEDTRIEATIDKASVTSGTNALDDHLRSPDFFDVLNWPTATYRSTRIAWEGRRGTLVGELTIKGVSRPVVLDVDLPRLCP
jgi:polyisoprenoid-binding protein YceI